MFLYNSSCEVQMLMVVEWGYKGQNLEVNGVISVFSEGLQPGLASMRKEQINIPMNVSQQAKIKAKQQSHLSWQNSDLLKKNMKQSVNPSEVSRLHVKILTDVLDIRRNPLKLLCPPVPVNAGLGRWAPSEAWPARSSTSQSSNRAGSHQGHIIIQKKTDCSGAVSGRQGEEKDKHCKARSIKGRRPETVSALRKSEERETAEASLKP